MLKRSFCHSPLRLSRVETLLLLSALRSGSCCISPFLTLWLQCFPDCPCQVPAVPSTGRSSASAEPAELLNTIGSVGSAQEGRSSPCPLPMSDPRALTEPVQGFGRLGLRKLSADLSRLGIGAMWALLGSLKSQCISPGKAPILLNGGETKAQLRVEMSPQAI